MSNPNGLQTLVTNGSVTVQQSNILTGKGWMVYGDTQYTSASPLVVANNRVKLTCNGLGSDTYKGEAPFGITDLWDTTTQKFTPENSGDSYDVRVQFKAKCSTVSAYFDVELDIGGSLGVITARTVSSSKGANNEQRYSIGIPIFTRDTFVANGGEIYINSTDSGTTVSIYDIQLFVKRDYASE